MTVVTAGQEAEDRVAVASNWKLVWWRFRRHHLALFVDGVAIRDKRDLSQAIGKDSEIYVMQALSGG